MGVQIPHGKAKFCGKGLNRSIWRLGCGLGWAEGSTSSITFAWWRQCAMCGDDAVLCQITLATCYSRSLYLSALRAAQRTGISFTQRPILRFFAPQGQHVASMGEIWHVLNFIPSVQRQGYRTLKTEIFTEILSKCGI